MLAGRSKRSAAAFFLMLVLPLAITLVAFSSLFLAKPDELSVGNQLVASPAAVTPVLTPTPDSDLLYQEGLNAYELGRYEAAEGYFREALLLLPESAVTFNRLGMTLVQLDRLDEAILAYNKAVALNPDLVEAHYNLGTVYQQLQRGIEAEQAYKNALDNDNSFALAYIGLGELYRERKDVASSIEAYEQATSLAPQQVIAWRGLGAALAEDGNWEQSAQVLETAVALQPDNASAHYDLGVAYSFLKMGTNARSEFALAHSLTDNEELKAAINERLAELPQ